MFGIVFYIFGKKYIKYLPLYLYSLQKNYPKYHVIIYAEYLSDKILDLIRFLGFENITIKKLPNIGLTSRVLKNKQIKKSIRWLHYDILFENFEYLYIGDIDIFLCPEKVELLEQHIKHMKLINLPYSNVIRKNSKRLSGLHFVKVYPYYRAIKPELNNFIKNLNKIDESKLNTVNDEEILFKLLNKVGLINNGIVDSKNNFRPIHGLHLGNWRLRDFLHRKLFKSSISHENYISCYRYFKDLLNKDNDLKIIIKKSGIEIRLIILLMNLDFRILANLNKK